MASEHTPTVLSIAGFDPFGGAGIVMDTKVVHALGGYAFSAVTAMTAQNSQGVSAVEPVDAQMLYAQLCTLLDDVHVDAVKIGMLGSAELIETVAKVLKQYRLVNVVLDPVLVSSSGKRLLEESAIETMIYKLFPLCRLVTPNLPETNALIDGDFKGSAKEVPLMAQALFELGAKNTLLKGGHTFEEEAVDYLVELSSITRFYSPRIETTHTHGTGCLLSSAIAAELAKGETLAQSVKHAKHFLFEKLQKSEMLQFDYTTKKRGRKEPIF